jgi:hypothetical protein
MKKVYSFLFCIIFSTLIFFPAFSEDHSPDGKVIGLTTGMRLSSLGFEPSVSLILDNLEIEGFCPIVRYTRDWDNLKAGYAPGGSIGFISSPFDTGWQNGIGISYIWFTPSYVDTTMAIWNFEENKNASEIMKSIINNGEHVFSFYYRGGVRFRSGVNLFFRIALPVVAYAPDLGDKGLRTIVDAYGGLASLAVCTLTQSIGIRFTF